MNDEDARDDLGRRLGALADTVGGTRVPAGLAGRVRRRRRVRAATAAAGSVAGALLVAGVAVGVWSGGRPDPDVPPAVRVAVPASCAPDALHADAPVADPDDSSAEVFSLTLARSSPTSCTLGAFTLTSDLTSEDGSERARATLSDVTLDPGATVDLRVHWDGAADCAAQPAVLLADSTVVGSLALPTCGAVTVEATVRPAS